MREGISDSNASNERCEIPNGKVGQHCSICRQGAYRLRPVDHSQLPFFFARTHASEAIVLCKHRQRETNPCRSMARPASTRGPRKKRTPGASLAGRPRLDGWPDSAMRNTTPEELGGGGSSTPARITSDSRRRTCGLTSTRTMIRSYGRSYGHTYGPIRAANFGGHALLR